MDSRVAVISIIVEKESAVNDLNALLHQYGQYIIGRLGPAAPAAPDMGGMY